MKIDIIGWYGRGNVGDEAFRDAFLNLLKSHQLRFVTPNCKPASPFPDLAILGGGAVVSPYYLKMLPPGVPRIAVGVDIAYRSEIDLLALADFSAVVVRNKGDLPDLSAKLKCPVHFLPDLAFSLAPVPQDVAADYSKSPKKVGVLVTDYVSPAIDRDVAELSKRHWSFSVNLAQSLDWLAEQGYTLVFIPCATNGYGDDRRINLNVAAFMQHRHKTVQIMDALPPAKLIKLVSQMDLNVCMRFHAHVFSILTRTPFVSIEFTRKTDMLLKELDLNYTKCAKFYDNVLDTSDFKNAVDRALAQELPPPPAADFSLIPELARLATAPVSP